MIDIGVNLTNNRFDKDLPEVIARANAAGIRGLIVTGTDLICSQRAVELVKSYSHQYPQLLYSTAGIHPHQASSCNKQTLDQLADVIRENPDIVVAVGETGLDFNRNFSPPQAQIDAFERHIALAIELELPLFLHERDAFACQRDVLKNFGAQLPPAVIHCFTGNREALEKYLEMGLSIGITGWVCDERRGEELQSLVNHIPLDRLMVETDAPYLTPRTLRPKPKSSRNEPAYLSEIIATIARLRGSSQHEIAVATAETARRFFRLQPLLANNSRQENYS